MQTKRGNDISIIIMWYNSNTIHYYNIILKQYWQYYSVLALVKGEPNDNIMDEIFSTKQKNHSFYVRFEQLILMKIIVVERNLYYEVLIILISKLILT